MRTDLSAFWLPFILLYCAAHVVIRTAIGAPLTPEEADLVLEARDLRLSYFGTLPLLIWLQYGVFQIIGESIFALSLLKQATMAALAIAVFAAVSGAAGRRYGWLAVLSLFFLPAVTWANQHQTSPDLLATFFAAAMILTVARWRPDTGAVWYLVFGTVAGLGALSAIGFAWFLVALFAALWTLPARRGLLKDPRTSFALCLTIMIAALPYADLLGVLSWNGWGRGDGIVYAEIIARAGGALACIRAGITFGAVVILGGIALTYKGLGPAPQTLGDGHLVLRDLMMRTGAIGFTLLLLHTLLTGTFDEELSRLQPILFVIAPATLLYLYPLLSKGAQRGTSRVAAAVALTILLTTPPHYAFRQKEAMAAMPGPPSVQTVVLKRL